MKKITDPSGENMNNGNIEILKEFKVDGGDPRWPISVEVQKRTATHDGRDKTYINLVIAVGHKRLFLPRRVGPDVAKLLEDAAAFASGAYEEMISEAQQPSKDIPGNGGNHRRRRRRRKESNNG